MMLQNAIIYEIKALTDSKDLYNISSISTETFNKMPFKTNNLVFLPNKTPKVGDLIEFNTELDWKLKTPYEIHTYELATVLGVQDYDLLLVYGNKIGEMKLTNSNSRAHDNNAAFDIQRGDVLLLNEWARGKFSISHNITQSQIKYLASLRTK